jgi:hypothetical protein
MRFISAVVFPLPAPARTSNGPFAANTALRCLSFKKTYSFSNMAFLSAKYSRFKSASIRFTSNIARAALLPARVTTGILHTPP